MLRVVACIDGSGATPAVCDYAAWASQHMETPMLLLHVLDEVMRHVLREHADLADPGVHAIRQRKVDDTELAAERHRRLHPVGRQSAKPRTAAAREHLSEVGFDHVTLDLSGYRTGSVSPAEAGTDDTDGERESAEAILDADYPVGE